LRAAQAASRNPERRERPLSKIPWDALKKIKMISPGGWTISEPGALNRPQFLKELVDSIQIGFG